MQISAKYKLYLKGPRNSLTKLNYVKKLNVLNFTPFKKYFMNCL